MKKHPYCQYRALLGKLHYLSLSVRVDIVWSVNQCARFAANPGKPHWDALCVILRYLHRYPDLGLRYGTPVENVSHCPLHAWTDASWASCVDTRRSCSGMVVYAWSGCIAWSSRREKIIALSSTEAEYCATVHAVKECLFLARIYRDDFGYSSLMVKEHTDITEAMFDHGAKPISIMTDNISCIHISKNPVQRRASKHMELRLHWTRDMVKQGRIRLVYAPTKEQVADLCTKGLHKGPFEHLRSRILHPLPGSVNDTAYKV